MSSTIPQHQTATAEELTDEAARTLHALAEQGARLVPCGQCWQQPGRPCTVSGTAGDHLARYQRAERRGLITRAELARVVADLDVIAPHVIIRDGAR